MNYKFENFIENTDNMFARAACIAITEKPIVAYNPLIIYGDKDTGKTHLLYAVKNKLNNEKPELKVKLVSLCDYIKQMISGLCEDVDVLLLDDCSCLVGRAKTQLEVAKTVKMLVSANKQVVLAFRCPLKDVPIFEKYIRSNIPMSLFCDIQKTDDEEMYLMHRRLLPKTCLFNRSLRFYLSAVSLTKDLMKYDDDSEALRKFREYVERNETEEIPICFEEADKLIELLRSINDANEETVKQYEIIKDFLLQKNIPELFEDVFDIISNLSEYGFNEMSFPVRKALFENFGSFFTNLCKDESVTGIKALLKEKETLRTQIIILSVRLALDDPANVESESNDICDNSFDNCDFSKAEEATLYDGYSKISKLIFDVESDTFKNMQDVKFLPYYFSLDDDMADTLIGNIIILRDINDKSQEVAYQIISRTYFSTYLKMFKKIKPSKFGFKHQDPKVLSQKLREFFDDMTSDEEALALGVIKVEA